MMGCKKERAVKYASSDASNPLETGMHWTLARLLPILCLSVLCLALLLYMKNPATRRKIFLCAATSFCLVFGSNSFFESCPTSLSSHKFLYRFYSLWLLVAVEIYAFTMQITSLQSEEEEKNKIEEKRKRRLEKKRKRTLENLLSPMPSMSVIGKY